MRCLGLFLGCWFCSIDTCLFLCQYHPNLLVIVLLHILKSGNVSPLVLSFLFKIPLAIQDLLCFNTNFRIIHSSCIKKNQNTQQHTPLWSLELDVLWVSLIWAGSALLLWQIDHYGYDGKQKWPPAHLVARSTLCSGWQPTCGQVSTNRLEGELQNGPLAGTSSPK